MKDPEIEFSESEIEIDDNGDFTVTFTMEVKENES